MPITSTNPATGETMETFRPMSWEEVDAKLEQSTMTFHEWRRGSFDDRARCMREVAAILDAEKEQFGRLMTQEMGKTLRSAVAEAEKCARGCRYYADNAERFLFDEEVKTEAERSYIHYLPIGPVLAVMPWNFPFWQVFRFAAPALMAGNVGLLKHASNVPRCALAIEDIFHRAGFPGGAFQTLLIGSSDVEEVINDPRVAAVTLTGSEAAGSSVASIAGRRIKKTVLELGGSDAFIVMPSADLEAATATAVQARVINNGQSCIAAKRFIVHETVYDTFEREFVRRMRGLNVGDPMDEATDVGPLATHDVLESLDDQVRRSIEMGARVLTGGRKLDGPGYYYQPTALADIPKVSPAYLEEIFGPVAMLFKVSSIDEAIAVANDTSFGLGSSAWTNNMEERQRFVDELQAGMTFINAMVASQPELPFGGVKHSGYGRELSYLGIREFCNAKTVYVKGSDAESHHRSQTE